jgi:hypothetical protein
MRVTRSDTISSLGVTLVPLDESPRAPPARAPPLTALKISIGICGQNFLRDLQTKFYTVPDSLPCYTKILLFTPRGGLSGLEIKDLLAC